MSDINDIFNIKIGDWIDCDGEGLGIVTRFHPLYWDIYSPEIHDGDEKKSRMFIYPEFGTPELGSFASARIVWKRFCNYDGTPIRSHKIRYSSTLGCDKANAKDMRIITNAIQKYPREYASFLKLDRDKETYLWIDYWVENREVAQFAEELFREKICKQLPDKFTSTELKEIMELNNCPFKLDEPAITGRIVLYPPTRVKIHLMLFYNIGDYIGKKTLFNYAKIVCFGRRY